MGMLAGRTIYHPYTGQDRHRDPLCDLPHLVYGSDLASLRLLYLFLLIAGPGHWGSRVQIYNHLFQRTSEVVACDDRLVTPAPPLPAAATEVDFRRMLDEQDTHSNDRVGVWDFVSELRDMMAPFAGQGAEQGMRYGLEEGLDMLRGWIADAGIQLVRGSGSGDVIEGGNLAGNGN